MTCLWSLDNNNAKMLLLRTKYVIKKKKINNISFSGKKDDDVSLSESEKLFTNARNENSAIAWMQTDIISVPFYYKVILSTALF